MLHFIQTLPAELSALESRVLTALTCVEVAFEAFEASDYSDPELFAQYQSRLREFETLERILEQRSLANAS